MAEGEETKAKGSNGAGAQSSEDTGAAGTNDSDLDDLLREFAAGVEEESEGEERQLDKRQESRPQADPRVDAIERRIVRQDLDSAIGLMQTEHPALKGLPKPAIEAVLSAEARRDTRITNAWLARHENPDGWNRVVKGLSGRIAKQFSSLPNAELTEDREAARAAVTGRSSGGDGGISEEKLRSMSDEEFDAYERELRRQEQLHPR
jgi:hypothetical protein